MKTRTHNSPAIIYAGLCLALSLLAQQAGATSFYYWDPEGAVAAPTAAQLVGTWTSSSANWSASSSGGTLISFPANNNAVFCSGTTAPSANATVTVSGTVSVGGIFNGPEAPPGFNITLNGGTISFPSGADAICNGGSDGYGTTINSVVAGTGAQIVLEGTVFTALYGVNTYTGGTQLGFSGTYPAYFNSIVYFNNGASFGASTGTITLTQYGNGAALVAGVTNAITIPNPVTVASSTTNNFVGNVAGVTYSGNWSLGANHLNFETGSTAGNVDIISGVISGSVGFTVSDLGTLQLTGVNTYTGNTTNSAVLTIAGAGSLGSGSYAGNIVNTGTFNYNSSAAQTFSGVLSGNAPGINGAGDLTLTGINTFTGTMTVQGGGTVSITADSGLGNTSAGVTLNNGCLKNNNSSPVVGSTRTITLGASGGYFDSGWSLPLTINAKVTGSGGLGINQDGGASVVLANTGNNYTGNTTIGTNGPSYYPPGTLAGLQLGASGVIPNGSGNGNVYIYATYAGQLDVNGFTQTINGLNGDGTVNNSTNNGSLSVGGNNATSTFSGVIKNSGGTLALTKVGTGILTLSGTNTYTGNTTLSAGTLALASTGSFNNTPSISIAAGATLDVSAISSFALTSSNKLTASGTSSAATIKGGTTVSLGSQPITLTYDGSHTPLTISQGTLSLNGNAFTVNGTALAPGSYTLIHQASGSVSATGSFSVAGTAVGAAGTTDSIVVSGGNVNLVVNATPTFSNLTTNTTVNYGATSILLTGTVSGTGSTYPTNGETVSATINGHTVNGTVSNSTGGFSVTYNDASLPTDGVGSYPITYAYAGNSAVYLNAATNNSTISLVINKAAVTVNATPQSKTYGQSVAIGSGNTNFTSSGLKNGDTIGSVTLAVSSSGNTTNAPVSGSPYTITISAAAGGTFNSANYTFSYVTNLLTVNAASLTVSATPQSKTYGQSIATGSGNTNFMSSGLQNGETIGSVTLAVSGSPSGDQTNAPVSGSPYTISISAAAGGTFTAGNYSIAYQTNALTVNAASVTVTATPQTKTYGQSIATGSGNTNFTSSGLQNGETIGSVTLAVSGSPSGDQTNAPVSGSPYIITPSAATGGTFAAANYTLAYQTNSLTVNTAALTVTATPQSKTYGQSIATGSGNTNFTSSGLQNGETIGSVTLAVSGSPSGDQTNAPVSGSPYIITPSGATDGTFTAGNYGISYQTNLLTVGPATLLVTANDYSRPYGATNVLTASYTNFVNGETLGTSDVGGAPALVSADTNADVGIYVITNSIGTLTSTNYTFSFSNAVLTVTNAVSTNAVTASTNPALPGAAVTFTATLSALAPSLAVPTNSVQFLIDSNAFGSPVFPSNGVVQFTNSALSHGYHVIEADYAGDTNATGNTNILGSTNTLTELINTPPTAIEFVVGTVMNTPVSFTVTKLLLSTGDADGDTVTLSALDSTSAQGGSVTNVAGTITYTPLSGYTGTDTFNYTVSDTYGATATSDVSVVVRLGNYSTTLSNLTTLGNGTIQFSASGIPSYTYHVQATTNLADPTSWATIDTTTAGTNGLILYVDVNSTNYSTRYYRLTQ